MARYASVPINPFDGLADSAVTSNTVPIWDAFDWTLSFRTTAGSGSTLTWQLSNATGDAFSDPVVPEVSWSDWTVVGQSGVALSGTTWLEGPLGARYVRFLRSDASQVVELNKVIR